MKKIFHPDGSVSTFVWFESRRVMTNELIACGWHYEGTDPHKVCRACNGRDNGRMTCMYCGGAGEENARDAR